METLPHDWLALAALVFVLGVKHGLDPDHLVAIDGLTRFNSQADRRLARWCGALFSLGHGTVVIAVALVVGVAAGRWIVPAWLDEVGTWISIGFLVALGSSISPRYSARLRTGSSVRSACAVGCSRGSRTPPARAPSRWSAPCSRCPSTPSRRPRFSRSRPRRSAGGRTSVALALLFMLGMTLADGANGLWIASLLRSADDRARIASRVLGLAVAGLSLVVAAFVVAGRYSAPVAAWASGREVASARASSAPSLLAFILGLTLARRPAVAPRT